MPRRFELPLFAAILSVLIFSSPARAQDRVALSYPAVDENAIDFYLQGEYYGPLYDDFGISDDHERWRDWPWDDDFRASPWKNIGLQVVALGKREYKGILYVGGLPGSGWNEIHKFELEGQRVGGTVDLRNPWFRAIVESEYAIVHASNGQPLGQIGKVHRVSPTIGAMAPWGSKVLFDGSNTRQLKDAKMTRHGLLIEGTELNDKFRDYTLHLEFRLPFMPHERGQGRGNSGVYLQSRYEVQVLDSFGLEGVENECAALYKQRRPDINMCLPPMAWQTYDIEFHAPRFDEAGNKIGDATLSVWHNGVAVHNNVVVTDKTGAGRPEGPEPLSTKLQDHSDPVRFRNIWVVNHAGPYPPTYPHPYPPVADPGVQYGTYIPPLVHFRDWEYPLPHRQAPSWFYYPDEIWR